MVSLAALIVAAGCNSGGSDEERAVAGAKQALSADQSRILGFETPAADWTSSVAISSSSNVQSGNAAMAAAVNGWADITSAPLSSLGPVSSTLSLAVRIPEMAHWGEIRIILVAPSLGLTWQDIGGQSLSAITPGSYQRLNFGLPANVITALSTGNYSDLRVHIIVNGPPMSGGYLIDDLQLAAVSSPIPSNKVHFSVVVPQGMTAPKVFMSASERLKIDDRVELAQTGSIETVASAGSVELGSGTLAHANVWAGSNIAFFRSQSHVWGFARAGGNISDQEAIAIVEGGRQQNSPWSVVTTSWDVDWKPGTVAADLAMDTTGTFAPGGYTRLNLQPRAVAHLSTGTYFFNSFNTEPESTVHLDMSQGPVVIYVKDAFKYKGAFVTDKGDATKLVVGYMGADAAFLQAPYTGGFVAPNGTIELQRPTSGKHRGSFFGRYVHAFSDSSILYAPIDMSFACPLGD
ncbi:MAG: hypothetical protein QM784_37120 [Polyangiaceae bacterium]